MDKAILQRSKASFIKRLLATIMDWIIISVMVTVFELFIDNFDLHYVMVAIMTLGIPFTYYVWLYTKYGATLGKMLIKIKVVDLNYEKISFSQVIIRLLSYWLSLIGFIGFLWIIIDQNNQGFHDKIAKTYVVNIMDHY